MTNERRRKRHLLRALGEQGCKAWYAKAAEIYKAAAVAALDPDSKGAKGREWHNTYSKASRACIREAHRQ